MAHLNIALRLCALLLLAGASNPTVAAPHAGDVQPHGRDGSIGINDTLFVGDFGDLPGGPFRSTIPGFDVDVDLGPLGAGNWLRYEALGALSFWNGAAWVAPVAGETFRIDDALASTANPADDTVINGEGVVARAVGIIGEVATNGGLHEHLTFGLRSANGTLGGTIGAYLVTLRLLETPANDDTVLRYSAPYVQVMNRGLSANDFDTAVAAAPAPVPLPAALPLMLTGLALVRGFRRRLAPVYSLVNMTTEGMA